MFMLDITGFYFINVESVRVYGKCKLLSENSLLWNLEPQNVKAKEGLSVHLWQPPPIVLGTTSDLAKVI